MVIDGNISATSPGYAVEPPAEGKAAGRGRAGATRASGAAPYAKVADQVADKTTANGAAIKPAQKAKTEKSFSLWENGAFGFGDFLDIINPLQHVPIVATIYRNLTGDRIGVAPRVIGGAVWGRIGGFVAGIVNAVTEWLTGKDIGDHIYTAIWQPQTTESNSAIAQAPAAPAVKSSEAQDSLKGLRPAPADLSQTSVNAPIRQQRQQTSQIILDLSSVPTTVFFSRLLRSNYDSPSRLSVESEDKQPRVRLTA